MVVSRDTGAHKGRPYGIAFRQVGATLVVAPLPINSILTNYQGVSPNCPVIPALIPFFNVRNPESLNPAE